MMIKLKKSVRILIILCMVLLVLSPAFAFPNDSAVQENTYNSFKSDGLQRLNALLFNNSIEDLFHKNKEAISKQIQIENFYNFELRDMKFDINTGLVVIALHARYKDKYNGIKISTEGTGQLECKILADNECSKLGIFINKCTSLKIPKVLNTIDISEMVRGEVNKKIAGNTYWTDGQKCNHFIEINNNTLGELINSIVLTDQNFKSYLKPVEFELPGGNAKVELKDIICKSLDITTGKAQLGCMLDIEVEIESGDKLKYDRCAELNISIDFYVHNVSKNWWAALSSFKLILSELDDNLNNLLNDALDKELKKREAMFDLGFTTPFVWKTEQIQAPIPIPVVTPPSLPVMYVYGDLNGDGIVNSSDLVLMKRYILGITDKLPVPYFETIVDLNSDGKIDTIDYSILKRYVIGIINELPLNEPTPSPTQKEALTPPPSNKPLLLPSPLNLDKVINGLSRDVDPVILTGEKVPSLTGIKPELLVAWKYTDKWEQIPVQVDERAYVNILDLYGANQTIRMLYKLLGREDIIELCYTDPNTFVSADPDISIDANDEIVFMAKDTGNRAINVKEPQGVVTGTGVEVKVIDPINKETLGYVYLFQQDGSLDQSAGKTYVKYEFNLLSGDYLTTYKTSGGPNPENSWIVTPFYAHRFTDRWKNDVLCLFTGINGAVDILDRHKNLFRPGDPTRSEDTFSDGRDDFPGEGCFITNKSGPVRAIRSYMGANSGVFTQRQHYFYESRHDITTFLRAHEISSVMDFFDYSPDAVGMKYYNNLNTNGVVIDGVQDFVTHGKIEWEMVDGIQGAIIIVHDIKTDIPDFTYTSYYLDDSNPIIPECTGDKYAYGSSGIFIDRRIPNTDPVLDKAYRLDISRCIYYESPGVTIENAEKLSTQGFTQLKSEIALWKIE